MKTRQYPSCVHALPIFVSFDETQIARVNGITKWLNLIYQTLLPFLSDKPRQI